MYVRARAPVSVCYTASMFIIIHTYVHISFFFVSKMFFNSLCSFIASLFYKKRRSRRNVWCDLIAYDNGAPATACLRLFVSKERPKTRSDKCRVDKFQCGVKFEKTQKSNCACSWCDLCWSVTACWCWFGWGLIDGLIFLQRWERSFLANEISILAS